MRILQILPELNVGGVETGTVDFGHYLVKHNHRSIVVSNGGSLVPELEAGGSKHYALPVHKKSLWTMVRMVKQVRKIIRQENVDIVHARSRVPAWIAYFAVRKTNASFVTTAHGYYHGWFFSRVMGFSKYVIVPSHVIGRHMIDFFKVSPSCIRPIPRGVNLKRFKLERQPKDLKEPPVIAIVGRLTPLKGHAYFIQAMAKVIRAMPYAKIWVIGDAPPRKESYRRDLETLSRRLGLRDNIKFWGKRDDVPELLAQTDVLVMSSIVPESFGRVVVEAQAMGVPVVATRIGGTAEIIDHERTGLLVMPKDTDAMAKEVLRLLQDKQLATSLTEAAVKKLQEEYTLEAMAEKTLAVYEELLSSMNILVIKLSSMGDVVLVTASLKAIREKFPKAKIYCLVGKESRKILQNCPVLDGIIVFDPKDKGVWRLFRLSRKLRKYRFDKTIDFQNNRSSHLLSFLSFPRESYGYKNRKWGFLLSHPVKDDNEPLAAVEHQFRVLNRLGIQYKDNTSLELWLSAKDHRHAKELLESEWIGPGKNIVGINISASAKWQTKNWPVEYVAQLCDKLAAQNVRVVITGMDKDRPRVRELLTLTKSRPAILVGKTDIMQLAAVIKQCKVFLTPDSAPMHLAASVHTPFIALFGPTDARRHVPPAKKKVIIDKQLACAPCYSSYCRILTHACMKDIEPEEVFQKIKQLLKSDE